jgi:hypothetical protein
MSKIKLGQSALDYLGFTAQDINDVSALSDERGGYWTEVEAFVADLSDRTAAELTFKQSQWGVSILEKLEDLRRKGKL